MSPRDATVARTRTDIAATLHEQFSRLTRWLRILELPQGMTPERISALSIIQKHGPISVTALADSEMVRPATMSRMVSALVDEGLAKRGEDEHDGRGVLVTITPMGRRAYRRVQQERLRRFSAALGSLSEDQLAAVGSLTQQLERFALLLDGALSELRVPDRNRSRSGAVKRKRNGSGQSDQGKQLAEAGDADERLEPLERRTAVGRGDDS